MGKELMKKYEKDELTVVWKPGTCIHAKECVKRLPQVYNPNERPWIKLENASIEELKSQIDACPSGALSYVIDGEEAPAEPSSGAVKAQVMENGPLLVTGNLEITHNGDQENKAGVTAFCRCGASNNKPYCDGQHAAINFQG